MEDAIDKKIEARIDMTPFENKILNDETGRTAWNPVEKRKLMFNGFYITLCIIHYMSG